VPNAQLVDAPALIKVAPPDVTFFCRATKRTHDTQASVWVLVSVFSDVGLQVSNFRFQVLGFRVSYFRFQVLDFEFWISGFGFPVSGSVLRVSGVGYTAIATRTRRSRADDCAISRQSRRSAFLSAKTLVSGVGVECWG